MRILWYVLRPAIVLASASLSLLFCYYLGSVAATSIEAFIRGIPHFFYQLPSYIVALFYYCIGIVRSAIDDPIHAISLVLGMLIVLTILRGLAGQFDMQPQVFRGSRVRTAEDVFAELDNYQEEPDRNDETVFRGSQLTDAESVEDSYQESIWSRITWAIKQKFSRTSNGDDLL